MNKKQVNRLVRLLSLITSFALMLSACQKPKNPEKTQEVSISRWNNDSKLNNYELGDVKYFNGGIEAYYPQIIGEVDEKRKLWNSLIKEDFDKIIQIYSFQPFPELEPTPYQREDMVILLVIDYVIKLKEDNFLSIFYTARYSSKYSAHPSELVYTTNIDLVKNKKIALKDIVTINQDFINSFRQWDFITYEENNVELIEGIKEYLKGISDEELMHGFMNADQISSNNTWGIYSYITPDKLGISLSIPHVIGDHVEFESEFEDISEFLIIDVK